MNPRAAATTTDAVTSGVFIGGPEGAMAPPVKIVTPMVGVTIREWPCHAA